MYMTDIFYSLNTFVEWTDCDCIDLPARELGRLGTGVLLPELGYPCTGPILPSMCDSSERCDSTLLDSNSNSF